MSVSASIAAGDVGESSAVPLGVVVWQGEANIDMHVWGEITAAAIE